MKAHIADLAEFWESIGASIEEQRNAAPWAFVAEPAPEPAPEPPQAPMALWENERIAWNAISGPGSREKPRRVLPGQYRAELLTKLEQFALL